MNGECNVGPGEWLIDFRIEIAVWHVSEMSPSMLHGRRSLFYEICFLPFHLKQKRENGDGGVGKGGGWVVG